MQIKRKLIGTRQDMIDYLSEARDAIESFDVEIFGTRDDTRAKRGERKGYMDGLEFAILALTDWEPTKEGSSDGPATT